MAANPFDQFDQPAAPTANPFDQFDKPVTEKKRPAVQRQQPKAFSAEDLRRVPQSLTAGVLQGLGSMGATLLAPFDYLVPEQYGGRPNRRAEITNALMELYMPSETGVSGFVRGVGNIAPIVAGTAGLGMPAAAAQRGLTGAIATGGLSRSVAGLPTRIAGGSIAGATGATYVNPEDTATGAVVGAALPVVGAVAGRTAKQLVDAYNALAPGAAEYRVAEMLRNALGTRLGATQAAQGASPEQVASLASAEASTPAYQALLRIGEQLDTEGTRFFADEAARQAERAALSRAAGGATQTEARAVRERSKDVLDEITRPMRERELELAGIGGTRGVALEQEAGRAGAAASRAVEDVRRFTGAVDRANEWARNWRASGTGEGPTGLPRPPTAATFPGELAERAEQVAGQRAAESLEQGALRREAETRLATLRAAGLEPLRPDTVIAGIRAKIGDPNVATNPNLTRALSRLNEMLQSWTNQNGVITPEALYAIRKNGINGVIEELMPNADVVTRKQFAAKVMAQVRPLIDDAIEKAGGKGWRDYLRTFEAGMADIERKELLAKAMELYDKNPDEFTRLVTAESPDVVENILGPGKYDVLEELTGQLGPLEQIVTSIRTRALSGEKAAAGAQAAGRLISESERNVRIPNFFSPKVTLTNEVLKGLEGKISADVLKLLSTASRSGKSANEAMMALPPADRNRVVQLVRQYITRNPGLQKTFTAGRPAAIAATATNAFAPPTNNNALSE